MRSMAIQGSYAPALFEKVCDWVHEPDGSPSGTLTIIAGESRRVTLPSIGYLRTEFPSEFWNFPDIATTVTHSLARFFATLLPKDPKIEHVYWFAEEDVLKVWTIIPEPDFDLQGPIYDAQMRFMEKLPEYMCDFSVIFRSEKSLNDIEPQGAYRLF